MSEHTPGPWRLALDADDLGAFAIYGDSPEPHGKDMVIVQRGIGTPNGAEGIANARLIAAAPELLDCCKELRVALAAAMRVIAGIDQARALGLEADSYQQRFVDEMHVSGVKDGIGVRAEQVIQRAEPDPVLPARPSGGA